MPEIPNQDEIEALKKDRMINVSKAAEKLSECTGMSFVVG
jgi:hypothetical protein